MSQKKYLDLAGLTAYDRKIKEWFKAGVVDIADEAIRALFVTVAEGPADNEIWYTTTTGEKINPINGASNSINSFTSHIYENNLGKLIYNENVTYISPGGFQGQHDLTTCYLPSSITEIYDYVFYDCPLLDKVYYNGTVEMWNNIELNAIAVGLSNSITVYCIDGKITIQPVN